MPPTNPPRERLEPIGIDLDRFAWSRPLTTACLRQFDTVRDLFAGNPRDPQAWQSTIKRVQAAPRDRAAISGVLTAQLTRRGAHPKAIEAARALSDQQTVAIVTGQQAGLFGGPLYTILKAITAIQLARRVERDSGVRVVPVFWIETDDHDWAEVRVAHVLDAEQRLRDLVTPDLPGAGQRPVGDLVLDERAAAIVQELGATLPPSAFIADLTNDLTRCYRPGMGFAEAFAMLLDGWFASYGMVAFEAYAADAKPLARDLFVKELSNPGRTARMVMDAAARMRQLGHAPQVEPSDDTVALFYHGPERREAIKLRDQRFAVGSAVRSAGELTSEADAHPERFSANVMLRPLVQDRLLPTICYVAGPAELAYQAQLGSVYEAFAVEPPLLMPRVSATLLDSSAARFLERHGLSVADLHDLEDLVLKRIVERALPVGIDEAIAAMQADIDERAPSLRAAVSGVDPTLGGAVDTTVDRMRDSLKSLHTKIVQATKRNDETLRRQFQRTYALVYPGGGPQERVLSGVFFQNRYGSELIPLLLDVLPLDTDQHYVLTL
jgi:bacillithiol biosynthesis cysteine-adding enzyme BshC